MKSRLISLIVSAACISGAMTACSDEKAEDLLSSAKAYLAKNDEKAAVIQLKNVLQKNPDLPEARFLLGQALLRGGNPMAASVELRKALDLKYPASQVVPALARSLVANRDYRQVIDQFSATSLEEKQAAADLSTSLAVAYASQDKKDKAYAALQAALESVPGYAPALVMQARLEVIERKLDKAAASIDKVLASSPSNAEALHLKGDLLLRDKAGLDTAIDFYRKALAIEPRYFPARASLINALFTKNDKPALAAQIEELRKIAPNNPQTLYFDAQLAYLNKDFKKAGELIQKVLSISSGTAQAFQLAGAIELQNQSYLRSQDYLGKALQLVPSLAGARRLLAQSYFLSKQPGKAMATLEPLLSSPSVDAETLLMAAQLKGQIGDKKQAEAYLLQAAKVDPKQTKSRVALALSHAGSGIPDETLKEIETIAAGDTGYYADLVLVNAYVRKGELDKALKAIETIEKKQPGTAYVVNLRGRVQMRRKDIADARRSFERALSIDPKFVDAAVNLALLDLADKKPDQAKKRFDDILSVDPGNMQAQLALAGLREKSGGSTEEVATLLAVAVKSNPVALAPRLSLIQHYVARKDSKRALAVAQEAVAALPKSPELLDALGRVQAAAGEKNQSINSFTKLASLQPESPQPYLRLAALYNEPKEADAARANLQRALAIEPGLLAAQRALVELEVRSNRPDAAIAIARAVRKQRPADPVGLLLEGDIETSRKNFTAAADLYRAGLKMAPSADLALRLHAVLNASSKTAEAERFAASWVSEHPKDSAFLLYLSESSMARRNYQVAEDYLRKVDQLVPGNAMVLNNLAWVLAQLDKPGAVEYAQKANALFPDSPVFLDTLASALRSEKQLAKAIETEKQALTLAPDAHGFRLSLIKMYIQSGDKASARAELDKLSKVGGKLVDQAEVSRLLATL